MKSALSGLAQGLTQGLSLGMQFRRNKADEKRIEQQGILQERRMSLAEDENRRANESHELASQAKKLQLGELERTAAASKTIEDAIKSAAAPKMEAVTVGDPEAEGATFPGDPAPGRVEYRENDPRSPEKRMLDGMDAGWMAAMKQGRADLAGKHFQEAFKMRTELRGKAMDEADQRFQATNDYSVYKDVYNDFVGDGRQIADIKPNDDGTIAVTFQEDGEDVTHNLPQEEMGQLVGMMRDPKAMRALETERAKKVFEHNLKVKEQGAKDDAAMQRARLGEEGAMERTRMTQEGAMTRAQMSERGANKRAVIAQRGLNARQDKAIAAAEAKDERVAARESAKATAKGGGSEKDDYEYGSSKGVAKWQDDFETDYLPKTEAKTADGKPKLDAEGKPVLEVDRELAGPMRSMAKMNKDAIQAQRVHPQAAAQAFQSVAGAFQEAKANAKNPDEARNAALEKLAGEGRVKIVKKDGKPVRAVGVMGEGAIFELPEELSQEILIADENRGRAKAERYDERERGFVQRAEPEGWTEAQKQRPAQAGVGAARPAEKPAEKKPEKKAEPKKEEKKKEEAPYRGAQGSNRERLRELIRQGVGVFR